MTNRHSSPGKKHLADISGLRRPLATWLLALFFLPVGCSIDVTPSAKYATEFVFRPAFTSLPGVVIRDMLLEADFTGSFLTYRMAPLDDGAYALRTNLAAGPYRYRFRVNMEDGGNLQFTDLTAGKWESAASGPHYAFRHVPKTPAVGRITCRIMEMVGATVSPWIMSPTDGRFSMGNLAVVSNNSCPVEFAISDPSPWPAGVFVRDSTYSTNLASERFDTAELVLENPAPDNDLGMIQMAYTNALLWPRDGIEMAITNCHFSWPPPHFLSSPHHTRLFVIDANYNMMYFQENIPPGQSSLSNLHLSGLTPGNRYYWFLVFRTSVIPGYYATKKAAFYAK
jgi:hypothetical protein